MVYSRRRGLGRLVLLRLLKMQPTTIAFARINMVPINQMQRCSTEPFKTIKHRATWITPVMGMLEPPPAPPTAPYDYYSMVSRLRGGGSVTPLLAVRIADLRHNPALSAMLELAYPALAVSFTMWLVLAWNIQTNKLRSRISQQRQHQPKTESESEKEHQKGIEQEIQQHRIEKLASLRQSILPLLVTVCTACLFAKSFPWSDALWQHGPSPIAIGLNFAYWASEIAMDTALDECGPLKLHVAATVSAIVQLLLILILTTHLTIVTTTGKPIGHMVFWLKATETLLATALAKLIDHPYWIGTATLAIAFVVLMAATGRLAPLPPNVPLTGAVAYFMYTFLCSTAYQWVQNSPKLANVVMGNIKFIRAGFGCLSMWVFRTPPSWILYDAINFTIFFCLKVATDTVALLAIKSKKS